MRLSLGSASAAEPLAGCDGFRKTAALRVIRTDFTSAFGLVPHWSAALAAIGLAQCSRTGSSAVRSRKGLRRRPCRLGASRSVPPAPFSQVRSAGSGAETQLRISWDGILNAEQTGRWWIVGSAWSGAPMIDNSEQKIAEKPPSGTV